MNIKQCLNRGLAEHGLCHAGVRTTDGIGPGRHAQPALQGRA
jgi:hypothetical protein